MIKQENSIVKSVFCLLLVCVLVSCGNDSVPKPNAYLRLDYPKAAYKNVNLNLPFTFEKNDLVSKTKVLKLRGKTESYGINLEYSNLKGTIYLTYKPVTNNKDNLLNYLRDAQNFTQEHSKKADAIESIVFENTENKVYGMLYEVSGNVASSSQFYVTDSIKHFLTGSLYFNTKPNYDSILPAINYLRKDIQHIMETIIWK